MPTSPPLELEAPDISPYRAGNTGVDYVTTFDSGRPGPHAMILTVMHGNELCGPIALDFLFRRNVRPRRGKLTFGFANVDAYLRFDPANPGVSRFLDEDMNRVWEDTLREDPGRTREVRRAKQLQPIIDSVDVLLDIHSMSSPTAPLLICHGLEKERRLSRKMGFPSFVVCGDGYVPGRRLIEYSLFNDPANKNTAVVVECGRHWAKATATVAIDTCLHFLRALEMIDSEFFEMHAVAAAPPPQRMLDITDGLSAKTDQFRWIRPFRGIEEIEKAGTVVGTDGPTELTTPYDHCFLVMPNRKPAKGGRLVRLAREVGHESKVASQESGV